jgi:release factor glutamine methyltransferase
VPEAAVATTAHALRAAERVLADAGRPDARRAALWLAAAALDRAPGVLWLERERPLAPALARRVARVAVAHARGVPLAYATGRVGFRTLTLACDRRALIPRPETEGLVDLVLRHGTGDRGERAGLAADLGTGSGCLALALAVEGRFTRVVAVERDPAAAALARENVARVRPPTPVEVREGDWLAPLGDARYRVIVANPPYLTMAEWDGLDPAVRAHEPRLALVSARDGLAATRAILAGARRRLAAGGVLAIEIDERRAPAVAAVGRELGWTRLTIHDDLFGRPRYAVAVAEDAA